VAGEIVLHGGQLPAPTTRDDVIRADIARGVPHDQIAGEWGLTVDVVDYIASTMRGEQRAGDLERSRYEHLLERFNPDGGDPDDRRDPRAAGFHRDRLAKSTRRTFRRYIGMYLDYCALTGRREIPGNRSTIEGFAIWLTDRPITKGKNKGRIGMAPASINVALSAVAAFHKACGENLPDRSLARGIIEGHVKRRIKDRVPDGVGSPAVDLPTFAELVAACDPNTNAGVRDRAMLTLGLNIMARRSELCILDLDDLKLQRGGQWLDVHVAETKTGSPRDPKVPAWTYMPELCPIRAWTAWRDRLHQVGIADGPAFRAVDRWDNIQGAGRWAGRAELGSRLDGSTLEHIVLRAAVKAAIPNAEELSPHGVLRRTGATQAYNFGADILAIARQGGWGERSPVVFRYIADVDQYKRNPMLLVGRSPS
jgi:integrase